MSLEIKNLYKQYNKNIIALKGISALFKKNQITGLIGFNGSGKTTAFNILAGLLDSFRGDVLLENKNIMFEDLEKISYLNAIHEDKNDNFVIDHLLFIGKLYNLKKHEILTKSFELAKELEFLHFMKFRIKKLSKGNKQKIKIIAAFLNPKMKYMLLDEPFDGIDPVMAKKIQNFIINRKKNTTIIITSHRLDIIDSICDSYILLKEGIIIKKQSKNFKDEQHIYVKINQHVNLNPMKKYVYVQEIKEQKDKSYIVKLKSIQSFKKFSEKVVNCKGYVYHQLLEKKLSDNVFEGYL